MSYCPDCGNILTLAPSLDAIQQSGGKKKVKKVIEDDDDVEDAKEEKKESKEAKEAKAVDEVEDENDEIDEKDEAEMERQREHVDGANQIIESIIDGKEVEIPKDFSPDDIRHSPSFRKLNSREKERVLNVIQEHLPKNKKKLFENVQVANDVAYWICKGCGFNKILEAGTLIFSEIINEQKNVAMSEDYKDIIYDPTLPNTHQYICANKRCPTHRDPTQKDAVFKRVGNSFRLVYVCRVCKTSWMT